MENSLKAHLPSLTVSGGKPEPGPSPVVSILNVAAKLKEMTFEVQDISTGLIITLLGSTVAHLSEESQDFAGHSLIH